MVRADGRQTGNRPNLDPWARSRDHSACRLFPRGSLPRYREDALEDRESEDGLKDPRKSLSSGRGGLPVVIERRPYNAETPMHALATSDITANRSFYVRNHFSIPKVDPSRWRLKVS